MALQDKYGTKIEDLVKGKHPGAKGKTIAERLSVNLKTYLNEIEYPPGYPTRKKDGWPKLDIRTVPTITKSTFYAGIMVEAVQLIISEEDFEKNMESQQSGRDELMKALRSGHFGCLLDEWDDDEKAEWTLRTSLVTQEFFNLFKACILEKALSMSDEIWKSDTWKNIVTSFELRMILHHLLILCNTESLYPAKTGSAVVLIMESLTLKSDGSQSGRASLKRFWTSLAALFCLYRRIWVSTATSLSQILTNEVNTLGQQLSIFDICDQALSVPDCLYENYNYSSLLNCTGSCTAGCHPYGCKLAKELYQRESKPYQKSTRLTNPEYAIERYTKIVYQPCENVKPVLRSHLVRHRQFIEQRSGSSLFKDTVGAIGQNIESFPGSGDSIKPLNIKPLLANLDDKGLRGQACRKVVHQVAAHGFQVSDMSIVQSSPISFFARPHPSIISCENAPATQQSEPSRPSLRQPLTSKQVSSRPTIKLQIQNSQPQTRSDALTPPTTPGHLPPQSHHGSTAEKSCDKPQTETKEHFALAYKHVPAQTTDAQEEVIEEVPSDDEDFSLHDPLIRSARQELISLVEDTDSSEQRPYHMGSSLSNIEIQSMMSELETYLEMSSRIDPHLVRRRYMAQIRRSDRWHDLYLGGRKNLSEKEKAPLRKLWEEAKATIWPMNALVHGPDAVQDAEVALLEPPRDATYAQSIDWGDDYFDNYHIPANLVLKTLRAPYTDSSGEYRLPRYQGQHIENLLNVLLATAHLYVISQPGSMQTELRSESRPPVDAVTFHGMPADLVAAEQDSVIKRLRQEHFNDNTPREKRPLTWKPAKIENIEVNTYQQVPVMIAFRYLVWKVEAALREWVSFRQPLPDNLIEEAIHVVAFLRWNTVNRQLNSTTTKPTEEHMRTQSWWFAFAECFQDPTARSPAKLFSSATAYTNYWMAEYRKISSHTTQIAS